MRLHGLLDLIDRWGGFAELASRLSRGQIAVVAPLEGAKPYLIAALQSRLQAPILLITARPGKARELREQVATWSAEPDQVLLFHEPDSLPYERMPAEPHAVAARLAAMSTLLSAPPGPTAPAAPIVVACARAVMEWVMSPEQLERSVMRVDTGQRIPMERTLRRWVELGYEAQPIVETPGTFSRRGGILDVFPLASPLPYRIEMFGDEVESVRTFDPATQRSAERVPGLTITPPMDVLPPGDSAVAGKLHALDLSRTNPAARESFEKELEQLARGQAIAALGFYRPFLAQSTLLDYLPKGGLLVLDDPAQIEAVADDLSEQAVQLQLQAVERGDIPGGLPHPLEAWGEIKGRLRSNHTGRLEMRYGPDAQDLPFSAPPSYGGKLKLVLDEAARQAAGDHPSVVVIASNQTERMAELLEERGRPTKPLAAIEQLPAPGLHLVHGSLQHGWSSQLLGTMVLSDQEVFGWTKAHRVVRRRAAPREAFLSDLAEGDLAVHIEHGIGRFRGLQRASSDGAEREFILLEYAAGDRLYVPVDQADRVARYVGAGEEAPSLSRLGTAEWDRAKERVKKSVRNVARELLQVYSARQAQPGHSFSPDTPWQGEMEASFPYVETSDQLAAVHEVKADMEAPKPMDRLICGDVGYGKTEVALRAAFKAVMDGRQVAVLVPTTVLAQQHYGTFRERLQAFPVNVEVLSRFRSEKEQRVVVEGLRSGAVDICIGTHRLIQKDVEFKNLGLVIVDEEQRFGVMHKERLKQLRQQVDVLTLSATPIPRTLHMSLAGIRDMSTMETAPEDRLPIRTFVADYNQATVREAILREMDRGGQVYFVHNRVENIHLIANQLRHLVPEARTAVGHGQMPEEALERVMLEFANGDHDLLVCTTIIESGLDIPNVNTIIVNNADRFGLAQLYQLRGRVGRGANRAYAYFLYSRGRQLSETAEKRLRTIFENTQLGSGFRIAMKDLEIRGAGNLLGVEQHGQVNAVGFNLYTRLLAEAVAELRGKPQKREHEVSIDLPIVAQLPPDYVQDDAARLSLYNRLASVKNDEQLAGLFEELRDRFGPLPEEAQNLLYVVSLRLQAARIGAKSLTTAEDEIVLRLDGIPLSVRGELQRRHGARVKVLPSQIRIRRTPGSSDWMPVLQEILEHLEARAQAVLSTA